jgi:hypothetical protein
MENIFTLSFNIQGTLAANHTVSWIAPFDCTLLHVSASNTTANAGTLKIGDSADDDEYLTSSNFGVSGTPAEYDGDDFVDTAGNLATRYYPRIVDGTIVLVTITDHASHMAAATVVLTFAKG